MFPLKLIAGLVFNVGLLRSFALCARRHVALVAHMSVPHGSLLVTTVSVLNIYSDNTGLLSERSRGLIQKEQPLWDKILVQLLVASYVGQIVFIPLDVFRFHLMHKPGTVVSFFGLALFVASWWIFILAMKVNPFAVPVVRLQEERHRRVIDTGGLCRRAASDVCWVCADDRRPGVVVGIVRCCSADDRPIAARIVFEERFLKRQLEGYEAYTQKVRYRLIPFCFS